MTTTFRIRNISTVLALGVAALSFGAHAQTSDAGAPPAATKPATGEGPVQRAEDATKRAGHATARGVKRAGHATANFGHKAAGAVRNTGEKIGSKLPPAPRDQGLDAQGVPRVTNN